MRKILYPLKADMFYFLLIWIAISLPNIYLQANNGNWVYSLYLLMMYYIIAYLVVLIVNLNAQVAKMIKPILLILVVLFSMANLYCAYTYKCLLSNDLIQIIAGTNPNEAKEYLETFVSWNEIVIFIFVLLASVIGGLYLSSHQITTTKAIWLGAGFLLIISIIGIGHNSGIIEEEFKNAKRWDFAFDEIVDLRKHLTYPQIIESDTIHPKNVVIILGESFSPNHSSLYGYDKQAFIGKENSVHFEGGFTAQYLSSHCFGAEKHHPFIKSCLDYYKDRHFVTSLNKDLPQALRLNIVLLPYIQAEIARQYGYDWKPSNQKLQECKSNLYIYPTDYFDPQKVSENSYCKHLAVGGWRIDKPTEPIYNLKYKITWRLL